MKTEEKSKSPQHMQILDEKKLSQIAMPFLSIGRTDMRRRALESPTLLGYQKIFFVSFGSNFYILLAIELTRVSRFASSFFGTTWMRLFQNRGHRCKTALHRLRRH